MIRHLQNFAVLETAITVLAIIVTARGHCRNMLLKLVLIAISVFQMSYSRT